MGRIVWACRALVLAMAVLLSVMGGHDAAAASNVPYVPLRAGEDVPTLAPFVRYFEPGSAADLPLIPNPPADRLRIVTTPDIQFGVAGSEVLAFVRLRNVSDRGGSWIFTTGRGTLNEFALYRLDQRGNGVPQLVLDGSDPRQVRDNLYEYQSFSHSLSLSPGEETTLALHVRTEGSTWMPLRIQTFPSFFADRRENIALVSAVVAAALILILFNVIFYTITGKREFAWLGAAQLVFTFNTIHAEGYSTIFLLYDYPLMGQWIGEILRSLFAVLMVQFGRVFLDTRRNFPRSDWLMRAAIAVGLGFIAMAAAAVLIGEDGWTAMRLACWAYLGLVAFGLPPIAVAAYRKLGRQHWPLVVSWTSLAGFIVYGAVAMSGLVNDLPITWHAIGPVGLVECAFATLALGLHLRALHADRLQAGVDLQQSLLRQVETSRATARLAQERASALAAVQDQDRLLHASGHDSRQVLMALNAVADFADTQGGQPMPGHVLSMIRSSASYLRDIIDTTRSAPILAHDGTSLVALGTFRADQPLRQLEKIHGPLLARKGVTCQIDCPPDLRLLSDRSLLTRALSNLVSNAVRFTDTGAVEIFAQAQGGHVLFGVRDSGSGIAPELIDGIMDDNRWHLPSGDGEGSGTGLLSARRIARALHGQLVLQSIPGKGTEAVIAVPMVLPVTAGAEPVLSEAQLQDACGGLALVHLDGGHAAVSAGDTAGGIGIASDTTAQTRDLAHSRRLSLILTRPLTIAMLHHPILKAVRAGRDPVLS